VAQAVEFLSRFAHVLNNKKTAVLIPQPLIMSRNQEGRFTAEVQLLEFFIPEFTHGSYFCRLSTILKLA
jgi:hypothetical protein